MNCFLHHNSDHNSGNLDVKIADFGLSALIEKPRPEALSEAPIGVPERSHNSTIMVANWTAMAQRKRLSRHASDRLTLDVSIKQKDGQLSGRTGSLMYMVGGWVGGWE